MSTSSGSGGRIVELDGLRAFAFLAVYANHTFSVPVAWAGVDLFFVLSGYLITGILLTQRGSDTYYKRFWGRRILRIIPPYFLTIGLTAIWYWPELKETLGWYVTFTSNFKDSFMSREPMALAPMWSLAVEEQFYLVWPFVVALTSRKSLRRLCIALLFIAPLIRIGFALEWDSFRPVYHLAFCRMDLLAVGSLFAVMQGDDRERFNDLTKYAWVAAAGALGVFLAMAVLMPAFRTSSNSVLFNGVGYSLIMVLMAGILGAVLRDGDLWYKRLLRLRPLTFIGTISYMLYLIHGLILEVLMDAEVGAVPRATIGLALSVVAATISWYAMEKPLTRFKSLLK